MLAESLIMTELKMVGDIHSLFPIKTSTKSLRIPHVNISKMIAFSSKLENCSNYIAFTGASMLKV